MGNPDSPIADLPEKEASAPPPDTRSADDDAAKHREPDRPRDNQDIEALIEEHILPRLDPDFLAYFVALQVRLRASQQQPAATNPTIEHVRAHAEAYQPPCAIDTSSHARVADAQYQSDDGAIVRARVYHPDPAAYGSGPYPVHLNFHGPLCHCYGRKPA